MSNITNNYAEGSCVFEAGSSQNGDVHITGPIYQGGAEKNDNPSTQLRTGSDSDNSANSTSEQSKDEVVQEELCHFIYPGLDEKEAQQVHRQIKDLVKRFPMKDICSFLNRLANENKILQPQIPQNAFEELHRMGMPPQDTKGFGYDNFCKYYRK